MPTMIGMKAALAVVAIGCAQGALSGTLWSDEGRGASIFGSQPPKRILQRRCQLKIRKMAVSMTIAVKQCRWRQACERAIWKQLSKERADQC